MGGAFHASQPHLQRPVLIEESADNEKVGHRLGQSMERGSERHLGRPGRQRGWALQQGCQVACTRAFQPPRLEAVLAKRHVAASLPDGALHVEAPRIGDVTGVGDGDELAVRHHGAHALRQEILAQGLDPERHRSVHGTASTRARWEFLHPEWLHRCFRSELVI